MVRLDANSYLEIKPLKSVFQFLHGAIGCNQMLSTFAELPIFQFLHGAIGCLNKTYVNDIRVIFQFLHGAIGCLITFMFSVILPNFNSYMVRLDVSLEKLVKVP